MSRRIAALGAACVAAAGCAGEQRQAVTSVRDSAGVQVVFNVAPDSLRDAVEVLRIGALEDDPNYEFVRIHGVVQHASGDLYVADQGTQSIKRFSPDGKFFREFGRRGDGPGEFMDINQLLIFGDTLVVNDSWRRGRTSLFSSDGTFIDSWEASWAGKNLSGFRNFFPVHHDSTGWIVWSTPFEEQSNKCVSVGSATDFHVTLHTFTGDSTPDLAPIVSLPIATLVPTGEPASSEGACTSSVFAPIGRFALDAAGRVFHARGAAAVVDVWDRRGRFERRVARQHEPRPVRKRDIGAYVDRRMSSIQIINAPGFETRADAERHIREQAAASTTTSFPAAGHLIVAPDGGFWLERLDQLPDTAFYDLDMFSEHRARAQPSHWDRYDASGRFLGMVRLPARFRPYALNGNRVLGVLSGEADVQYVVMYEPGPLAPAR